MMTLNEKAKR